MHHLVRALWRSWVLETLTVLRLPKVMRQSGIESLMKEVVTVQASSLEMHFDVSGSDVFESLGLNLILTESQKKFISIVLDSLFSTEKDDSGNIVSIRIDGETNAVQLREILKNAVEGEGCLVELVQNWMAVTSPNKLILYAAAKLSFKDLQQEIVANLTDETEGARTGSLLANIGDTYNGGSQNLHNLDWNANEATKAVLGDLERLDFANALELFDDEEDWRNLFLTDDFYKNKLFTPSENGKIINHRDVDAAEQIENAGAAARIKNARPNQSTVPLRSYVHSPVVRDSNPIRKDEPVKFEPTHPSEKDARFWTLNRMMRAEVLPILIAKGNKLYKAGGGAALMPPIAQIENGKITTLYISSTAGQTLASTDGNTVGKWSSTTLWLKLDGNRVYEYPGGAPVTAFMEGENCTKQQLAMAAVIYLLDKAGKLR